VRPKWTAPRGAPSPLPTVADPDPFLSRWAQLRARELRERASAWMPRAPAAAAGLRAHAHCLDPWAGSTAQAAVVRVTREPMETNEPKPRLAAVTRSPAASPRPEFDAWPRAKASPHRAATATRPDVSAPPPPTPAALRALPSGSSVVLRAVSSRPPAASPALASGSLVRSGTPTPTAAAAPGHAPTSPEPPRDLLAPIRGAVRAARFEEALASIDGVRSRLHEPRARAELEVLAATASLALGRDRDARRQFAAALRADPDLRLDPLEHSPKLRALLAAVRAERREP